MAAKTTSKHIISPGTGGTSKRSGGGGGGGSGSGNTSVDTSCGSNSTTRYRANSSHGPPWRKIAAAMSTLHNHVSSSNNNNNNNNNNNGNSNNLNNNSSNQQSSPFVHGSPSLTNNHHLHYHQQRSVDSSSSNIVNNNTSSSSSPATTTTSTTTSGGGVGGILGVRDVGAKKFLPSFARSMMMSSLSSSAHHHHHHHPPAPQSADPPAPNTSAASASSSLSSGWMGSMGDGFGNGGGPSAAGAPTSGTAAPGGAPGASSSGSSAAGGNGGAGGPSGGSGGGRSAFPIPDALNVVLHGYQRKLKTNKKKYFVVYGDTPDKFARLEYFDSEKKFKQSFAKLLGGGVGGAVGGSDGPVAKRSIVLRSCFNINRRHDSKKQIIALFTKDDCFCIVFESEDELNRWLRTLLRLQRGEESEGDPPRPTFEHVWDVLVQPKGLGDSYGILGSYRLCITDKVLSLVRIGLELTASHERRADVVEFSLASIRRCGHSQRYFYLEVGRSSKTGAGEIWMEVQDSFIAQNMYTTIMKSAKNKDDNLGPMIRIRSSSANAASKPTSMLFRRQTHAGQKPMNCSPSSEEQSGSQNASASSAQNSESSSSAASINTVVLVGSPPKTPTGAGAGAPNSKPVRAAPCAALFATSTTCSATATSTSTTTATSYSTTATTSTATSTPIPTTATTTTTTTMTAMSTSSVAAASSISPGYHPAAAAAATIVSFTGIAARAPGAAGLPPIACGDRSSTSSSSSPLASLGSCSPIDVYVPLVPGAGCSTSNSTNPIHPLAGVVGGGGGVAGVAGASGSPRLGVTAQSPSYRRASFKRTSSTEGKLGGACKGSPQQQQQHHPLHHPLHHHPQHLHHGQVVPLLPPSSAHHSHLNHPHHHHHQHHHHLHHHPLPPAATLPRPATPSSTFAGAAVGTSGVSSSGNSIGTKSGGSTNHNVAADVATTDVSSSSSTDHAATICSTNNNASSVAASPALVTATTMSGAASNSSMVMMMMTTTALPPSPSASMSKFHHYASSRAMGVSGGGGGAAGGGGSSSAGSVTFSSLLASITSSIVAVGGGGDVGGAAAATAAALVGCSDGGVGGCFSPREGSFSNSASSKSSSCCSSTASIQTTIPPPMGPPLPLPPPPPPPVPRRCHTRSLSHHLTTTVATGAIHPHTKPLRRLRCSLRRHSVSVTSASSASGVFHQRALSLPSAPMLGHPPHSNTYHLSAINHQNPSSSSQTSVLGAAGGAGGGGQTLATSSRTTVTTGCLSTSLSSSGTIKPVHHRTRSLPLTEESAIRVTTDRAMGGGGWWGAGGGQQQAHYYTAASGGVVTGSHRKSSSSYLLAPPASGGGGGAAGHLLCPLHGGGYSPPMSELLCNSPQDELPPAPPPPHPSRSSMESIIEDQRYLPMDLKKPPSVGAAESGPHEPPNGSGGSPGGSGQLQLISRLLRSSNLQPASSSSSSAQSTGKMGLIGLKMALLGSGNGGSSNGGCSCSSPSSQCSSSSNHCAYALSSPNISLLTHKSTNGSSPAALRRPNGGGAGGGGGGGRAASGTISRSVAIARERCDSLPSRNRTTSETMPHQQQQQQHLQQQQQQQHLQQQQQHQLMLNSGGMPPPRMIPSGNRPHSMHISSCHGHSPPVNSSPLSPPPATYSTGSDGSSYSIDESTDSFITDPPTPDEGNGYKVINHLNSGGSIPEENSEEFIKDYGHIDLRLGGGSSGLSQHDEYGGGGAAQTHFRMSPQSDGKPSNSYNSSYHHPQNSHHHTNSTTTTITARLGHHHNSLSLPISQAARRGGSPAPPSTVGSVEGSAYMEMCSPAGSSPGDPSGSCYMAMSPVADYSRGLCSSSSAHSRASSLAEDLVDGYVPMNMSRTTTTTTTVTPQSQPGPEEYVIMDPTLNGTSSRLSNATERSGAGGGGHNGIAGMSSAASSCSITSGTPSTDLRLSLEKVPAYIGQSDEGEVNDRPYRTYSVGSRPEHIKRKLRIDMLSSAEGGLGGGGGGAGAGGGGSASSSRQRAFSVGSRAKVPRCSEMYKGYSQAPIIVSFVSSSSQGSVTESNNNSGGSTSSIPHVGSFGSAAGPDALPNLPLDESGIGGRAGSSGSLLVEWKPPLGSGGAVANHGSVDHMADLMEIDYSSPRQAGADEAGHNSSSTPLKRPGVAAAVIPGMEDYLDMSGSGNAAYGDSPSQNYNSHALKDLFEDKEHHQHHPPAAALSMEGDYLNMTPGGGGGVDVVDGPHATAGSSKSTSNPIQISSPKKYGAVMEGATTNSSAGKNNNYLDMYPRMQQQQQQQQPKGPSSDTSGAGVAATKVPSEDYLNMTPLMMMNTATAAEKSDGSEEKLAVDGSVSSGSAPDGYMEMSFNHNNTTTMNNLSSTEDYMNMTAGTGAPSAPITIQPGAGKCRLDLSGESKVEVTANIPNYLPLGGHHHPHHHHHHVHHHAAGETARKGAAETTTTTIVSLKQPVQTTTGQQSGSVGFSPSKGGGGGAGAVAVLRARCDSRDSGIVTPSGSQSIIFPFSPGSPPTRPFPAAGAEDQQQQQQQPPAKGVETLEDLSQNYAELSLGRQQQQQQQLQHQQSVEPELGRKLSTGSRSSGTFGGRTVSLASPGVVQPDYVNFCPVAPTTPGSSSEDRMVLPAAAQQTAARCSRLEDDGAGDYALMNPASARKQSTTSMGGGAGAASAGVAVGSFSSVSGSGSGGSSSATAGGSTSNSPPVLVAKKSTFLSNPLMGFKPIASTQDAELLAAGQHAQQQPAKVLNCTASSPKANFSRRMDGAPTAFSFEQQSSSSSGQQPPLQRSFSGTRPNSVNSELIAGRGTIAMIGAVGVAGGTGTPTTTTTTGGGGTTRPNSANSERLPIISATSSSASSTSTLCESKNQSPSASCTAIAAASFSGVTAAGAAETRPDSVSSVTDPHFISRPPSVSSERELHYASLDLPPCSKTTPAAGGAATAATACAVPLASSASSSALLVQKMDVDEPYDVLSTSTPSPGCTSQPPIRCGGASTYAQIDFLRSQAQTKQQHQQQQQQLPALVAAAAVSTATGPSPSAGGGPGGSGTPQSSQA